MHHRQSQNAEKKRPLTPAEQAVLDKAKAKLQKLAESPEIRAELADGWIGVLINVQQGRVQGRPREYREVSTP